MDLEKKIESLLFFKSEPVSVDTLSTLLDASREDVNNSLTKLEQDLSERGIRIIRNDKKVMLATAPENSSLIEKLVKEELEKDLGKAGLETLTIVLYLGPVTRSRVDYIRGVNSTYILRHLSVRGLIERAVNKEDQRSYLYMPTFELLSYLGVAKVSELPEYETVKKEIETFEARKEEGQNISIDGNN